MAAKIPLCSILLAFLLAGATSEGESPLDDALSTGICQICSCKDRKVDCFQRNLTTFFSKDEWSKLEEFKPTHVDLSDNFIINVTFIDADLPIEILNMSRNKIENIENASFKRLQKMKVLDLSHNKLTSEKLSPHAFEGVFLPERYEPLKSMRVLNLGYNQLHSLHQDLFEHLADLTELDLSGNPLTMIDHPTIIAISSLPSLRILRMRSCQLAEIPDKLLHTPRYLERLDLADNKLAEVPQELAETKNLVYLNLNQNPIVSIPSEDGFSFPRLPKLQELHLCNMPRLRTIGAGSLSELTGLLTLHISYNSKLSKIEARALARPDDEGEAYSYPPLKELYLKSNNLSEIDSRLVARWDLIKSVDVTDNPYSCDCSTQWMVDVLVKEIEARTVNASSNMVCQEPVEMRGYTMKHLHDISSRMRCLDKYGNRPERDGAILMGCLIGVLLSVPIMLSLMLLWRRGYFSWLGMRGPVDVSRAFYKRAPADEGFM